MVLRRKRPAQDDTAELRPVWVDRFDEAASMIRSRPHPPWIEDRISDVFAALSAANTDIENLTASIEQLDADGTAAQLKQALREAQAGLPGSTATDSQRRVATLRRRYEAVNAMANQRQELAQLVADSIADLELLAVESVRAASTTATTTSAPPSSASAGDSHGLDQHLARLEVDLQALAAARREVDAW